MCMRRKKPTASDSQYDAIAQNMGAIDASTKYLTINSAYSSNDSATNQDLIDINGSTKVDETPLYEDMEEVRKTNHEKKNEFELNEDKANCRAEGDVDITESFYDNDIYFKKTE